MLNDPLAVVIATIPPLRATEIGTTTQRIPCRDRALLYKIKLDNVSGHNVLATVARGIRDTAGLLCYDDVAHSSTSARSPL